MIKTNIIIKGYSRTKEDFIKEFTNIKAIEEYGKQNPQYRIELL
jgi:hypothetical protein